MKHPHSKVFVRATSWLLLLLLMSCRGPEIVVPTEYEIIPDALRPGDPLEGMYLVNEGNMGSDKATLDFLDYHQGLYMRNIYAERNPNVVKELGDVGNDILVCGSKLYIVVNCSHKVEVLDAYSCKRITKIDIPNCRYVHFAKGKLYVSSYVGPVRIDPKAPLGAVYRIDTATLKITGRVTVGYQPEQMASDNNYLYVANSGGYRVPNYDNTVSIVDLERFVQIKQIPVAINLHHIKKDKYNNFWVSSRGNYQDVKSNLIKMSYNASGFIVPVDTLNIPCSNFAISGDSLYYYATEWNEYKQENSISYGIVNIKTNEKVSDHFIDEASKSRIQIPYGIAIHPYTKEIYITDATNYVSSGRLNCFSADGTFKWQVRTGDIPAHMAFLPARK